MFDIATLEGIAALQESTDVECKLAQGRDGKGALPKDFWPTYSAFANTRGGDVFLGVHEKAGGRFELAGVDNPQKVIDELWTGLNNAQKVSCNLLDEHSLKVLKIDGKAVVHVHVPAATRKQKPVYLNGNPLTGTYRRFNSTDHRLDEEPVRRMLAEQIEDSRDDQILPGFGWEDIDPQSLTIYRQMLKDAKPSHPFLEHDDFNLLKKIKGWRKDRQTGEEGLTLAGLLIFGAWDAIQEAAPHYFVDYQERPEAKTELRWVDRLVPDGSWSGNLFDFYRIVYRKLTNPETLKVPFRLKSGQRRDDTPVHEAIREALVNTLIHADFTGRVSVLVVKRPDMLGFRNPGDMRIPLDRAVRGGESDCRNRIMHQMFLMIGLGERAGSGIPKIYSGWDWRHWRRPALYEVDEPPQTLLELRMLELMPEDIQQQLTDRFGDAYSTLSRLERLILATAATEQVVSHGRISEITTDHAHDITLVLQSLVKQGMLEPNGQHGRGAVYHLPGDNMPTPEQVFGVSIDAQQGALPDAAEQHMESSGDNVNYSGGTAGYSGGTAGYSGGTAGYSGGTAGYSGGTAGYSGDNASYSGGTAGYSGDSIDARYESHLSTRQPAADRRDDVGRLLSPELDAPAIHDLTTLTPEFYARLEAIAQPSATSKRLKSAVMRSIIYRLCSGQYVTRACLAKLLNRTADTLRHQHLQKMIEDDLLRPAFPQTPNDKRQAYIAMVNRKEPPESGIE